MKPEAYQGYCRYGGRDKAYYKFGRGFYFLGQTEDELIPRSWLSEFWGEFKFVPNTEARGAGVDLAFSLKGDKAILFTYRAGMAWGWRPEHSSDLIRFSTPRYAVQLDQAFSLRKLPPLAMYDQIMKLCRENALDMDWVAMDSSGLGYSFVPMFPERGQKVMAVDWSQAATHTKVMESDTYFADEVFDGLVSEMFFSFAFWAVSGYVKCSPYLMDRGEFETQLLGRRRKPSSRKGPTGRPMMRLEQKADYKTRFGVSPDIADAAVLCLHRARMKGPERARLSKRPGTVWTPKVAAYENFDATKTINWTEN